MHVYLYLFIFSLATFTIPELTADTESNGQTISRDTSKDLNKSESGLPSPISDTYDETSETKKCLDPIEEDGNQDGRNNTKESQYSQMYEAPEAEEDDEKERGFNRGEAGDSPYTTTKINV
uniref:Secreted protein n=1 Tax=Octopus bimaculoides TaxID=37653 RepID=A0A0L8HU53_OCTBM